MDVFHKIIGSPSNVKEKKEEISISLMNQEISSKQVLSLTSNVSDDEQNDDWAVGIVKESLSSDEEQDAISKEVEENQNSHPEHNEGMDFGLDEISLPVIMEEDEEDEDEEESETEQKNRIIDLSQIQEYEAEEQNSCLYPRILDIARTLCLFAMSANFILASIHIDPYYLLTSLTSTFDFWLAGTLCYVAITIIDIMKGRSKGTAKIVSCSFSLIGGLLWLTACMFLRESHFEWNLWCWLWLAGSIFNLIAITIQAIGVDFFRGIPSQFVILLIAASYIANLLFICGVVGLIYLSDTLEQCDDCVFPIGMMIGGSVTYAVYSILDIMADETGYENEQALVERSTQAGAERVSSFQLIDTMSILSLCIMCIFFLSGSCFMIPRVYFPEIYIPLFWSIGVLSYIVFSTIDISRRTSKGRLEIHLGSIALVGAIFWFIASIFFFKDTFDLKVWGSIWVAGSICKLYVVSCDFVILLMKKEGRVLKFLSLSFDWVGSILFIVGPVSFLREGGYNQFNESTPSAIYFLSGSVMFSFHSFSFAWDKLNEENQTECDDESNLLHQARDIDEHDVTAEGDAGDKNILDDREREDLEEEQDFEAYGNADVSSLSSSEEEKVKNGELEGVNIERNSQSSDEC